MKLFGLKVPFTASDPLPETDDQRVRRVYTELGGTGTLNYDGLLKSEDYNPDLQADRGLRNFDLMSRSDPAVRESLYHLEGPIINARWAVESPEQPTELEEEITAFYHAALFDWMTEPFTTFVSNALRYLRFGHMVFEQVYQVVDESLYVPNDADETAENEQTPGSGGVVGDSPVPPGNSPPSGSSDVQQGAPLAQPAPPKLRQLPKRQYVTWRKFAPRLPRTIWKWNIDEHEELKSITQMVPKTRADGTQYYAFPEIPANRLLVLVNEKWGGDWRGISVLRSAYKPWKLKDALERIMGVAFERHGVGLPVAYMPRAKEGDEEMEEQIEDMLQNLRGGEYSYVIFPGPKAMGNIDGFTFEILSPAGGGIPDFRNALEYLRGEIKGAMVTRFSELGHSQQSGARSTANVQSEVWYNVLHAIATTLADEINLAGRKLIDMNFSGRGDYRYPRLKATQIETRNILEFSQSLALLANSKLLTADDGTRSWVRDVIDGPQENLEEASLYRTIDLDTFLEQAAPQAKPAVDAHVDAQVQHAKRLASTRPEDLAKPRATNSNGHPTNR